MHNYSVIMSSWQCLASPVTFNLFMWSKVNHSLLPFNFHVHIFQLSGHSRVRRVIKYRHTLIFDNMWKDSLFNNFTICPKLRSYSFRIHRWNLTPHIFWPMTQNFASYVPILIAVTTTFSFKLLSNNSYRKI